ncbi:hypothetical protein HDV64DRAFT_88697 [Trichoderma sp. TUCIM 5745]
MYRRQAASEPHRSKYRLAGARTHFFFFSLSLILSSILLVFLLRFSLSFAPTLRPRRAPFPTFGGLFCLFLLVLVASPPPFLSLFLCATQINAIVSWLAIVLRKS